MKVLLISPALPEPRVNAGEPIRQLQNGDRVTNFILAFSYLVDTCGLKYGVNAL
jgi:hypothetical protein